MFVPYQDDTPRYRTQYVTYALIAINVLVFFVFWKSRQAEEENIRFLLKYGSLSSRLNILLDVKDVKELLDIPNVHGGFNPIRSVTSGFLHADFMHLLGNMWFLFLFGGAVEGKLGHIRMGLTYLVCLVLSDLAQHILDREFMICIGASGAVGGMVGAYWFLFCRAQIEFFYFVFISFSGTVALTVHWAVAWLFGWDLVMWLLSSKVKSEVAHSAHLGGLVCGLLCGLGLRQFSHMTLDGEDMLSRFVIWRARRKQSVAYFESRGKPKTTAQESNIPDIAPSANGNGPMATPPPAPPPPPEEKGPKTLDF